MGIICCSFTCKVNIAFAKVEIDFIPTLTADAWRRRALVDIHITVDACVTTLTRAGIPIDVINANAMYAGRRATFINVCFTMIIGVAIVT